MGGSPENTVAKIREAVHMNNKEERDKYLGEVKTFVWS